MCVCGALPLPQFECIVDRMRESIAGKLWRLLVVDSRLIDHLDRLKREFLFALRSPEAAGVDAAAAAATDAVKPGGITTATPVYVVESPLHLVLTPSAMERYAELHGFLAYLRTISCELMDRCVSLLCVLSWWSTPPWPVGVVAAVWLFGCVAVR